MRAAKRLLSHTKKTACEYTHLQVWVWDARKLHKTIHLMCVLRQLDSQSFVTEDCRRAWANICSLLGFLWIRIASAETSKINLQCFHFPSNSFLLLHEFTWNLNILILEWSFWRKVAISVRVVQGISHRKKVFPQILPNKLSLAIKLR